MSWTKKGFVIALLLLGTVLLFHGQIRDFLVHNYLNIGHQKKFIFVLIK